MENQERPVIIIGDIYGNVTVGANSPITITNSGAYVAGNVEGTVTVSAGALEVENRLLREERDYLRGLVERLLTSKPGNGQNKPK